jgi:hypothetical protein
MDDKTNALLQDAAFGEGGLDTEALANVLAGSSEARQRLAQLAALAEALRIEGSVAPPARLTRTVMDAVSNGRSRHDSFNERTEEPMNKKWIVGIAATVAAALGIYVAAGGSIPPRGTEGTIGAAKRYQGQQISASDVQLGDQALQSFLQSTTFDKLRRDPALRKSFIKVVSSPAFAKVAGDASFASLTNNAAFLALATDAELRLLAVDAELRYLATDTSLEHLAVDADLKRVATDAALKELTNDANFKMLADDAELKHLANDAALKQLMIDADFMKLMQHANLVNLLQDAHLKLLLTDANLKLLTDDAALAQLSNDAGLNGAGLKR